MRDEKKQQSDHEPEERDAIDPLAPANNVFPDRQECSLTALGFWFLKGIVKAPPSGGAFV
jgi:hypothetical protein